MATPTYLVFPMDKLRDAAIQAQYPVVGDELMHQLISGSQVADLAAIVSDGTILQEGVFVGPSVGIEELLRRVGNACRCKGKSCKKVISRVLRSSGQLPSTEDHLLLYAGVEEELSARRVPVEHLIHTNGSVN